MNQDSECKLNFNDRWPFKCVLFARLRELLIRENQLYRDEAVAMEPTIETRIADGREKLKQLQDRKEKERQEFVKKKYLQQARFILDLRVGATSFWIVSVACFV